MKEPRRLALNAERLTELSTGELRAVNGGGLTIKDHCADIRHPSEHFVSLCECVTRNCFTGDCA